MASRGHNGTDKGEGGDDEVQVVVDTRPAANTASGDAQSATSSQGHEDYFEKELRHFIRRNRDEVARRKAAMQRQERKTEAKVAALADERALLDAQADAKERAWTTKLTYEETTAEQRNDLRQKLKALREKKESARQEIDTRVSVAEDELYSRRVEYGQFVDDMESGKEAAESRAIAQASAAKFAHFSKMEYLTRGEKRPPAATDTTLEKQNHVEDMRELQHLRNIRQAHENYETYVSAFNVGASPAKRSPQKLLPLKRTRIAAPRPTDPPSKKTKVVRPTPKMRKDAIEVAAKKIAQYVQDWRRMDGADSDEEADGRDQPDERSVMSPVQPEFVHEGQLQEALKPYLLLTRGWAAEAQETPATAHEGDEIMKMQHEILRRLDVQTGIMHLHSLALAKCVHALADVKASIIGDVKKDLETARLLRQANQAVVLASDPDLARLPFRSVSSLNAFMKVFANVEKLSLYILNFCPYVDKVYSGALVTALLHPELQQRVAWMKGTAKPK